MEPLFRAALLLEKSVGFWMRFSNFQTRNSLWGYRKLILLFCLLVTGPLTESQIAYVLRETLQVSSNQTFQLSSFCLIVVSFFCSKLCLMCPAGSLLSAQQRKDAQRHQSELQCVDDDIQYEPIRSISGDIKCLSQIFSGLCVMD